MKVMTKEGMEKANRSQKLSNIFGEEFNGEDPDSKKRMARIPKLLGEKVVMKGRVLRRE